MHLSEISIRRPVFAWMLMFGLILFGAISFSRMGISQLPDVDFPVISVGLTYEGAAPEVMETDIVDVVEDAVMTVQGVKSVSSYSRLGTASVSIEFELGRDIDVALQEVQSKVAQAQRRLPNDMDQPTIHKSNPEDQPILWLSLSSTTHSTREIMAFARDQMKDRFSTVSGVSEVMLGGYVDPNLRVAVSNKSLKNFELTIGDILDTVSGQHSELPAGQIEMPSRELDVRVMGEAKSSDEFKRLPILARGGRPNFRALVLSEVAEVEEGLAEVRRISRTNGTPAIGLGIKKQRGTNAVRVAKDVKARLAEVRPNLPKGMDLSVNFDSTKFIEESVGELNFTLVLSAILTALVCLLFLGSLSGTLNILLAIPTSIVGTFIILHFAGFTLNTFTLLGLSLAIGIVVDDAIMVLENIVRHRGLGKNRTQAAIDGSKEISFAAIAATIAIVAIFLPVAFMRGVMGAFFLQFGVTLTVAVMLSLLEALTLTPMRCAAFVEGGDRSSRFGLAIDGVFKSIAMKYFKILGWALQHRWSVTFISLAFFALSLFAIKFIPKELAPAQDQGSFMVRLQGPVESSLAATDERFKQAEKILQARSEVVRIYAAIGGFTGGEVNSGIIFVTMRPKGSRGKDPKLGHELSQQEFMNVLREELAVIPDTRVMIQDMSLRGFSSSRGFPLEFSVRGPDWEKLGEYSKEIMDDLNKSGLVQDLDSDFKLGKPEVRVLPDRERAAQFGVSIRSISETIRATIGGMTAGKYSVGGHRYDVRVRLQPEDRAQSEQIKDLYVRNNRGELVKMSDVVKLEERKSLQQIARYDRDRSVGVFGNFSKGVSVDKAMATIQETATAKLPPDYRVVFSGGAQSFKESFQDLIFALWLGIIVAYMVLASQFNSFIHPITVLLALPFSLSGAFLALWATGQSINMFSFIGIILLMGIVKKNSILLVEFTNQVKEHEGLLTKDALLKACPIRLRPILMTSMATIAASIPPALALGPGAETRVPMAIAVIGGVLVSTLLTLVVVPCVYSLFDQGLSRFKETKRAA